MHKIILILSAVALFMAACSTGGLLQEDKPTLEHIPDTNTSVAAPTSTPVPTQPPPTPTVEPSPH